jgi:hypothetical protein
VRCVPDQDRRDGNASPNERSEQNRNNGNAPSTTGQGGQRGGERGNMPKGQQNGGQKGMPSNRDREK